jgi:hypothetical protein
MFLITMFRPWLKIYNKRLLSIKSFFRLLKGASNVKAPWVSVFKHENASPSEMEFSRPVSDRICYSKSEALVIPLNTTQAQPGRLAQSIFPLPC